MKSIVLKAILILALLVGVFGYATRSNALCQRISDEKLEKIIKDFDETGCNEDIKRQGTVNLDKELQAILGFWNDDFQFWTHYMAFERTKDGRLWYFDNVFNLNDHSRDKRVIPCYIKYGGVKYKMDNIKFLDSNVKKLYWTSDTIGDIKAVALTESGRKFTIYVNPHCYKEFCEKIKALPYWFDGAEYFIKVRVLTVNNMPWQMSVYKRYWYEKKMLKEKKGGITV